MREDIAQAQAVRTSIAARIERWRKIAERIKGDAFEADALEITEFWRTRLRDLDARIENEQRLEKRDV